MATAVNSQVTLQTTAPSAGPVDPLTAVSRALGLVGGTKDFSGNPVMTGLTSWCLRFIGSLYGHATTGIATAKEAMAQWMTHPSHNPMDAPYGSLVFFNPGGGVDPAGHIGISLGNGQMISAHSGKVIQEAITGVWAKQFAGWGNAPWAIIPPTGITPTLPIPIPRPGFPTPGTTTPNPRVTPPIQTPGPVQTPTQVQTPWSFLPPDIPIINYPGGSVKLNLREPFAWLMRIFLSLIAIWMIIYGIMKLFNADKTIVEAVKTAVKVS